VKLFFFFAASGAIAYAIRRVAGQEWIERKSDQIDGLNGIAVFVFAAAAMDGVPRHVMADPLFAFGLLAFIVALTCVLVGISMLIFLRAGTSSALVIGLVAGFRNLGLVMAAIGTTLPDIAWFYFALAQFPIYILPMVVKPLARRLRQRAAG
jgi:BASS family bile acid:Na+ symporter